MARVNHKLVKQRLNEERSKISDRQFFTSRLLAGHFEDMAAAQTRRYNYCRRVCVRIYWDTKDTENIAYTNNRLICINAGCKFVTKVKGRENRYKIICGLFAHELGHVLYTDFLADQSHTNYLKQQRWFPFPPNMKGYNDAKKEKMMWNYIESNPDNFVFVAELAKGLSNIIEDGYIENRILIDYPGTLGYGLETLRKLHYEHFPTVTQLIEEENDGRRHICESIMQIILSYAKYGEIKYGDEPLSDERIQTVFGLIADIDEALANKFGKERLNATNVIMVRCWNYIEDFIEILKSRAAATGATASSIINGILKSIAGNTQRGSGTSRPVSEDDKYPVSSATASKRNDTIKDANESSENKDNDSEKSDNKGNDSKKSENKVSENEESEANTPSNGFFSGGASNSADESKSDRIPYHQTDKVYTPENGSVERNDDYERERNEKAASDIERILDEMAERAACAELENERIKELNEVAQNISYGNVHSGVNVSVNRIQTVDEEMIEQYNQVAPHLLAISKQMQRGIIREIKDKQRGGKQTGLVFGRRLDEHHLYRNDGKIFYKNNLPDEIPKMAVALLLDESGSMGCDDRCTYARAAAIILHDFCKSVNIPIMVYGHTTSYKKGGVELFSYAEFDTYDNDDKYRMMDIKSRGANRDGAAIRFVAEQLAKRPEFIKILMIVSDGEPADFGYSGTAAEEDLRGIKQEYQRKDIIFVAAAIGDDKENIERIYGDSFLDITDLSLLPQKIISVIKRHLP